LRGKIKSHAGSHTHTHTHTHARTHKMSDQDYIVSDYVDSHDVSSPEHTLIDVEQFGISDIANFGYTKLFNKASWADKQCLPDEIVLKSTCIQVEETESGKSVAKNCVSRDPTGFTRAEVVDLVCACCMKLSNVLNEDGGDTYSICNGGLRFVIVLPTTPPTVSAWIDH
jgi:hypothetical protein